MPGSLTGGSHPQVSYQVASKQELEVIYEPVQPATSRTVWLLLAGLVLLLCLAGGTGVALWQSGLLGGQSHLNTTTSSSYNAACQTCYAQIHDKIYHAYNACGGLGLFFSVFELLAIFITYRFRTQINSLGF